MAELYRPDGPASGEPCEVEIEDVGLRVQTESAERFLPYSKLKGRLGGYSDGWMIFTMTEGLGLELWVDPEVLAFLKTRADEYPRSFRKELFSLEMKQRTRLRVRFAIRVVAASCVIGFVGWFLQGDLVSRVVDVVPPSIESELGKVAAAPLVEEYELCEDPRLVPAVNMVLRRLVGPVGTTRYPFRVRILKSEEANAFALPGGEILVMSGLLALIEDVHELAAVLGHEVQHVLLRHGLAGIVRRAGIKASIGLVLGDASEVLQVLGAYAGDLAVMKYGRDQEEDADMGGVVRLAGMGFDPEGAVRFFERLADEQEEAGGGSGVSALLSTHPSSRSRTARLEALVHEISRSPIEAPHVDWARLRNRCDPGFTPAQVR